MSEHPHTQRAAEIADRTQELITDALDDLEIDPDGWLKAEADLTLAVAASLLGLPPGQLRVALASRG